MQNPWRIGAAPKSRVRNQQVQHTKLEPHELCSTLVLPKLEARRSITVAHPVKRVHAARKRTRSTLPQESVEILYSIPAPGILPWPVAPARVSETYQDIEFFFKEVIPPQHAACEVFDVHDLFDEYLHRPMAALVFLTWQCNVSYMRAKLAPTSTFRHQYYKKYGQVLATLKEQLLDTDVQWRLSEALFVTMLLLINVSYTAETSDVGDLHLKKLYGMLSRGGTSGAPEVSRFATSAFRQLTSNCDIVRGRTLDLVSTSIYVPADSPPQILQTDYDLSSVTSLPEGCRNLVAAGTLSPPTIRILMRLTEFVPGRPHACRATFQTFEDACPCLNTKQMTFEKFFSLTVMIYCYLRFPPNSIGLQPTLAFNSRRGLLTKAILVYQTESLVEKTSMIWMFAVSLQSCIDKKGVVSSEGYRLLSEVHRRYADLTWPTIESTLNMFHWEPKWTRHLRQLFEIQYYPINSDTATCR